MSYHDVHVSNDDLRTVDGFTTYMNCMLSMKLGVTDVQVIPVMKKFKKAVAQYLKKNKEPTYDTFINMKYNGKK